MKYNFFRADDDTAPEPAETVELGDEGLIVTDPSDEPEDEPVVTPAAELDDEAWWARANANPDLVRSLVEQVQGRGTDNEPLGFDLNDHVDARGQLDVDGANAAILAALKAGEDRAVSKATQAFEQKFGSSIHNLTVERAAARIAREEGLDEDQEAYIAGRLSKVRPEVVGNVKADREFYETIIDAAHGSVRRKSSMNPDPARTTVPGRTTTIQYGPDGKEGYLSFCRIMELDPGSAKARQLGKQEGALR